MKHSDLSLLSIALVVLVWDGPQAHAGFGRKIDLNSLPGHYSYVETPNTALCPATLIVTYDAENGILDGSGSLDGSAVMQEVFHFSNLNHKGAVEQGGIQTDPASASYSDHWVVTKLTSNSIIGQTVDHTVTSSTRGFPMFPEPLEGVVGLPEYFNTVTTRVSYDPKTRILKKSENYGVGTGGNCNYQKDE